MSSVISSGINILDELLSRGFRQELHYLLYGDKRLITDVLLRTSVMAQKSYSLGGLGEGIKVAFIDGNNRFNPYNVSKFAVAQNLSPQKVLKNILISRAFSWDHLVEILENKLSKLEDVKVVLISGIIALFKDHEMFAFEDLLKKIGKIKIMLMRTNPLIIITASPLEHSHFKLKGGKAFSDLTDVLVMINDNDRYIEYVLIKHPFLPENRLLKWKVSRSKKPLRPKFMTMDHWLQEDK